MGTMTRNGLMKQPVSSLHSQYKIKQKQSLLTISKVDLNNRLKVDIHLTMPPTIRIVEINCRH